MRRGAAIGAILVIAAIGIAAVGWQGLQQIQTPATPKATPVGAVTTASGSPTPSPSPSPDAWDLALAQARELPLEDAAGQVIMPAISAPDPDAAAALVSSRHLAGLLVMGDAVTDKAGVAALTSAIAQADPGRRVIVATDEEGGTVQRLRPVLGFVSAFMAAGANGDPAQIRAYYAGLGAQMARLGFTMTMAPVADVTIGVKDPTIRTRSAGSEPDAVAHAVSAAWEGFAAGGVTPVVKHFPGHGSVTTDSHLGLPRQPETIDQLGVADLVPFSAAINDGVPAVMVGHIAVKGWGSTPTSVNPRAYAYLRDELGFTGLTITDAMNMDAITDRYTSGEAAVAALRAGADLVLMPASTDDAIAGVVSAVKGGELSRDRLDEAAARVILAAQWRPQGEAGAAAAAVAPERPAEFVEGSIVVASDRCSALVGDSATIAGGTAAQRKALAAALRDHGVTVGASGTVIRLVNGDRGHGEGDVVVAMGGPWGLPRSTADTYVATWGSGKEQMRALAAVLSGDVEPRGTWPVTVKLAVSTCG